MPACQLTVHEAKKARGKSAIKHESDGDEAASSGLHKQVEPQQQPRAAAVKKEDNDEKSAGMLEQEVSLISVRAIIKHTNWGTS